MSSEIAKVFSDSGATIAMNSATDPQSWFDRAQKVIPGGVNSPVRALRAVCGDPVYVRSGSGSRLTTIDGKELLDFCGSWGPLILGHAHPEVVAAVQEAAAKGTSFGINTPGEVELAELICDLVPGMDMVRLVSSGTEATMTALRLARGASGRNKMIKFDGCYHGHSDSLLVAAGSGLLTGGISSSAGVPDKVVEDVILLPYNDLPAVDHVVSAIGNELACIIVEPVAGNMGLIPPVAGFLEGLRSACDRCGAVLIFDEVITGFRLGPSSYGAICGVTPDLTCLGKIIGGGLPIGAVGGHESIMTCLSPLGGVYQAGTLSGNPVAVAAGLSTLRILLREQPYERLADLGKRLAEGMNTIGTATGRCTCRSLGGAFTVFFSQALPQDLASVKACNMGDFANFYRAMFAGGIYLPPSQFETAFISMAHTEQDIDRFLSLAGETI